MTDASQPGLESRLKRIEDMLEIYNLIATHPPFADTGAMQFARNIWADDAVFQRSDGQGAMTLAEMEAKQGDPGHAAAMAGGMAHFCGHPYVRVDGDRAMAISYLQLLAPDRLAEPQTIPAHGASSGFFVHKVVVNKWDLTRTAAGWRVRNRIAARLNGDVTPRDLLMQVLEHPG